MADVAEGAEQQIVTSEGTGAASKNSSGMLFGLLLVLGVVVVIAGVWYYIGIRNDAAEAEAAGTLKEMGTIVSMTGDRKHVATLNLMTLKTEEKITEAVAQIQHLQELHNLVANSTPFNDAHLTKAAENDSIVGLQLNYTNVTDKGIASLPALPDLKSLTIQGTEITNTSLESIAKLSNLTNLTMSQTKIKGDLAAIANMPKLDWLLVTGLDLDEKAADNLARLPNLSKVTMNPSTLSEAARDKLTTKGITVQLVSEDIGRSGVNETPEDGSDQ